MIFLYPTKKDLKAAVGQPLKYRETSMFGDEYTANGEIVGAHRPHITGEGREYFATVTMKDGKIAKVS